MTVDWRGSRASVFRGFVDDNYVDNKPDTNGDGGGGEARAGYLSVGCRPVVSPLVQLPTSIVARCFTRSRRRSVRSRGSKREKEKTRGGYVSGGGVFPGVRYCGDERRRRRRVSPLLLLLRKQPEDTSQTPSAPRRILLQDQTPPVLVRRLRPSARSHPPPPPLLPPLTLFRIVASSRVRSSSSFQLSSLICTT